MRLLYTKRNFCILGDNLYAVVPFVSKITDYGWQYIITAKPDRNKELFSWYQFMKNERKKYEYVDFSGHIHKYIWINSLPLKQEDKEEKFFKVNFLEYCEYDKSGEVIYHNTWVTFYDLNEHNVISVWCLLKGTRRVSR